MPCGYEFLDEGLGDATSGAGDKYLHGERLSGDLAEERACSCHDTGAGELGGAWFYFGEGYRVLTQVIFACRLGATYVGWLRA